MELPLYSVGLNLAELDLHGGEGFWDEVRQFSERSTLAEHLDAIIGGRASPRVWIFLDAPDQGPTAVAAALCAARLLADRGQAVVLVDADDQNPQLTRWLGRHEQEGWIDMVRYGASLHMASDALPSDGRRGAALGVGSFTPTGVTAAEVSDLVARLRRQADDLIIAAPAVAASLPWCEAADVRVLAWDRLARTQAATEALVDDLRAKGIHPTAFVGFGVEEYAAVERLGPNEGKVAVAETREAVPAGIAIDSSPADAPRPRHSSGIFWFAAVAAVVCLLLLGYFYLDSRRATEPQQPQVTRRPAQAEMTPQLPAMTTSAESETVAAAAPETTATTALATGPQTTAPQVAVQTPPPAETPAETPVETPVERPAEAPSEPEADYTSPVGRDGWAIWVYSLATPELADREMRELSRRHIASVSRKVALPTRGTWYRVYVGNFPSKEAARAAMPALKERLHTDWCVPARVPAE